MNKQNELNLETIGVEDFVKPLNNVEVIEIEGGSRESEKQSNWFRAIVNFIVGGSSAGSIGGAASIV